MIEIVLNLDISVCFIINILSSPHQMSSILAPVYNDAS